MYVYKFCLCVGTCIFVVVAYVGVDVYVGNHPTSHVHLTNRGSPLPVTPLTPHYAYSPKSACSGTPALLSKAAITGKLPHPFDIYVASRNPNSSQYSRLSRKHFNQ